MTMLFRYLPAEVGCIALMALGWWFWDGPRHDLPLRVEGLDGRPSMAPSTAAAGNAVDRGRSLAGPGKPADLFGTWSRFRGEGQGQVRWPGQVDPGPWSESGPTKLWALDLGEGYAGAAIWQGRALVMDYDRENREEVLRCLSLQDGREIWRYAYPNALKRDHGITRTVPAVTSNSVVAIGSKCHVLCAEIETGKLRWSIDMVNELGATVPPWYTGQCPLLEGHQVILAPGGTNTLLAAVDIPSGAILWRAPNPRGWKMTHSSVMPVVFAGRRMFVYCASGGVLGVSAENGAILWDTPEWKIRLATVPCPVDLGRGRIFLTGGYNAGSMILQLKEQEGRIVPQVALRLEAEVFGATQHTPILRDDHLYGVRADGRFVCLDLNGKVVWTSEAGDRFGLGSFIMVNDSILALNDGGMLHLIEANPAAYRLRAKARILEGPESWAPMAFADGRLLARDLQTLVCLDLAGRSPATVAVR